MKKQDYMNTVSRNRLLALTKFRDEEQKLVHKGELIYAHYQTCDGI